MSDRGVSDPVAGVSSRPGTPMGPSDHGRNAQRRLPIGAEPTVDGGVDFRVWAADHESVAVVIEGDGGASRRCPLRSEGGGYFSGRVADASAGALYRFAFDGRNDLFPDPASRFQPEGPHGPSQVVDPSAYVWEDSAWRGSPAARHVIYEMHVGTFTAAGTFAAAADELVELAAAGMTLVEVMPIAEFPGSFGWGYDGVDLFAPTRLYGGPHDFRRFVDRAHAAGLGVILDVVYNHVGPDGNYLAQFARAYFTDRYDNDWGAAINFDGADAAPVREFFVTNARYWMEEFHLDGLRLDATQSIHDRSPEHVLAEISHTVRAAGRGRKIFLVAENEPQNVKLLGAPEKGGYGIDALWNDDFHHSARVALTGRREAYYTDYCGTPQELLSAVKRGFLYQGQWYSWQKQPRGTPTRGLEASFMVLYLENHDQVANSRRGERLHALASPARMRAVTALMLLAPSHVMIFQGQEFSASSPFLYFADHHGGLAPRVARGRAKFLEQFPSLSHPETAAELPDPGSPDTFTRSKLRLQERVEHAEAYALHVELNALRRDDPVLSRAAWKTIDGAVLSDAAFVLRFFDDSPASADRILIVNLGRDLSLSPAPEPLLAPPAGAAWEVLRTSEDPRYGGLGIPPLDTRGGWRVPAECAVLLGAVPSAVAR